MVRMSAVWAIIIPMLMVQLNLVNSQSANCSSNSIGCLSSLTNDFTEDCNAGRLRNYAKCLSDSGCLSPSTADIHLNLQYCGEGGCIISCIEGDPLACAFMCRRPTGDENTKKRQNIIFQFCTDCFNFGGASSTTATISVLIGATAFAISTFM